MSHVWPLGRHICAEWYTFLSFLGSLVRIVDPSPYVTEYQECAHYEGQRRRDVGFSLLCTVPTFLTFP